MKQKNWIRIGLRPYAGTLYVTNDRLVFERLYCRISGTKTRIEEGVCGKCSSGLSKEGEWSCIVFAGTPWDMAHELTHAVVSLFERVGIVTAGGNDEPFAYMLSQLMYDTRELYGKPIKKKRK